MPLTVRQPLATLQTTETEKAARSAAVRTDDSTRAGFCGVGGRENVLRTLDGCEVVGEGEGRCEGEDEGREVSRCSGRLGSGVAPRQQHLGCG